jgi:tRNA(fMet)-specific endonuclease VapC
VTAQFLLDTNIISAMIDDPMGRVMQRAFRAGEERVATSIIVAGELRFGVTKRNAQRLSVRVEEMLATLLVFPIEAPTDVYYGRVRAELEKRGRPIGNNDLWIAAHAMALDLTLVTDNVDEFSRVDGLRIENWLRP